MTFASVFLLCLAAITLCVTLVFSVETLVAFCLHEEVQELAAPVPFQIVLPPVPEFEEVETEQAA